MREQASLLLMDGWINNLHKNCFMLNIKIQFTSYICLLAVGTVGSGGLYDKRLLQTFSYISTKGDCFLFPPPLFLYLTKGGIKKA